MLRKSLCKKNLFFFTLIFICIGGFLLTCTSKSIFLASPNNRSAKVILEKRGWCRRCIIENIWGSSHDGTLPRNIAKVDGIPGKEIYRSGKLKLEFIPALLRLGIKNIVTLNSVSPQTRQAIASAGIMHREFYFSRANMTVKGIREAINAILDSPDPVLVHCHGGADRTGIVIAALRASLDEKDVDKLRWEMIKYCHITWKKYEYFYGLLDEFIKE